MDPPHNPMQAMFDGMSAGWQRARAGEGLTLGSLVERLEAEDPDAEVYGLGVLKSYRGYYDDLAFDPEARRCTVADLLAECRRAMGRVFSGYKGGDFLMGETTPLWVSPYGDCTGMRLVDLRPDGEGTLLPITVCEDEETHP
jgi:hypothetical protein